MAENITKDFEEGFQNILDYDLYERITNYDEEISGNAHKSILQNTSVIRLDFLLKLILEMTFDKKMAEYQQIHTLIKLQKINKPDVFSEVLPGNKNLKFIENCFI